MASIIMIPRAPRPGSQHTDREPCFDETTVGTRMAWHRRQELHYEEMMSLAWTASCIIYVSLVSTYTHTNITALPISNSR